MRRIDRAARALAGAALAAACAAHAGEAHVHGQGSLDVAVDGGTLTVRLESPMDSFVGFERAPRNEKERERVRRMAQGLQAGAAFAPAAAAKCRLEYAAVSSPVLDPSLLAAANAGRAPPSGPEDDDGKGHAEIVGEYVYACQDAAALRSLEVRLFDTFKAIQRLDVQVAGPHGQTATRLTPGKRTVSW